MVVESEFEFELDKAVFVDVPEPSSGCNFGDETVFKFSKGSNLFINWSRISLISSDCSWIEFSKTCKQFFNLSLKLVAVGSCDWLSLESGVGSQDLILSKVGVVAGWTDEESWSARSHGATDNL